MFYSAKTLHQSKIDYSKLLDGILRSRHLVRAIAYVIQKPDIDQTSFLDALERSGYEVKAKELRLRSDGTSKGDWDMGIALDSLTLARKLDVIVLVTGDGDFVPLVLVLKSMGCRVEVVSFHESTSNELVRCADQFIPIEEEMLFKEKKFMINNNDGNDDHRRDRYNSNDSGESYRSRCSVNSSNRRGEANEVLSEGRRNAYDPDES